MWFSKWFFPQYCLIIMIEKWRRSVDGGGQAGPFLTDISKAFNCTDHELFNSKTSCLRFHKNSLYFIN